jgi:hypothetical protein
MAIEAVIYVFLTWRYYMGQVFAAPHTMRNAQGS